MKSGIFLKVRREDGPEVVDILDATATDLHHHEFNHPSAGWPLLHALLRYLRSVKL